VGVLTYITPTPVGEFTKLFTILDRSFTTNELGESVPVETATRKVWGKLKPLQSTKLYENAQIELNVTHEIRTRYFSGITSQDSFQYHGRQFDIASIIDIMEQHIELLFLVKEQRA
jgi:SPP1 family predicted phage head-tail adaptor